MVKQIKNLYNQLDNIKFRFEIFLFLLFSLFVALIVKILFILNSDNINKIKSRILPKQTHGRLNITDRKGKLLTINKEVYDFYLEPSKIINIKQNFENASAIIPEISKNSVNLLRKMYLLKKDDKSGFVLVKSNLTEEQKEELINNGILGLYFEKKLIRYYPYENLTAHVIGFTDRDSKNGLSGIEASFNSYLNNASNDKPLQLSIDIELQEISRNVLLDIVQKYNAKGGSVIIVNKSGEILSAVSLPDFNPNEYYLATYESLFNRFSLGVYELGSVFKLFLGAYSNEMGYDVYGNYERKEYNVGNFTIHDVHGLEKKGGLVSLFDGIVMSSNVICAQAIEKIGYKEYYKFLKKLKLFQKPDIELFELGKPIRPKKESLTNAITISYGHGLAITIINYMYSLLTVLNDGIETKLSFIKKDESEKNINSKQIISSESSQIVKQIMQKVFKDKPYPIFQELVVGGKTGTSEKISSTGGYNKNKNNLQIVFALPIEDPKFIGFIMLDEPETKQLASQVLVPYVSIFLNEIKKIF